MVHRWAMIVSLCCLGLASAHAQEAGTAENVFDEQTQLPLTLQALPPSTSFFLFMPDVNRFRDEFQRRAINLLAQEQDAEKWRLAGFGPALHLASEVFVDLAGAFHNLTGDFIVGRTEPGEWFIVTGRPQGDPEKEKTLAGIFDFRGFDAHVWHNNRLLGASSRRTLATVWTMLAFPNVAREELPGLNAFKGSDPAFRPDDIYRFWLDLPATAGAAANESFIWGRAFWDEVGVHHYAELVAGATSSTLDALFADDNDGFPSFALLPEQPLTVFAARFRSAPALYDALMKWQSAPAPIKGIVARFPALAEAARVSDLRRELFANLGGEWAFATLAGGDLNPPWLLLAEVRDAAAITRFVQRLGRPVTQGGLSARAFTLNDRPLYLAQLGKYLVLSNRHDALQAARNPSGANSFASSPMFGQADQRLTAKGVCYAFHHSLACLTQQADQAAQLPFDKPGYFAFPPGAVDLSQLQRPALSALDVYRQNTLWGCAQLRRSSRGLTLEARSPTGLGPLELTAAALFAPLVQARFDARFKRTREAMLTFANALQEYRSRVGELPVIEGYEFDPSFAKQLNLSPEAWLDPYAKRKRPLFFFAREGKFVVLSRGPDRDLDLNLREDFDPLANNPFHAVGDKIYSLGKGPTGNGDIVYLGSFK